MPGLDGRRGPNVEAARFYNRTGPDAEQPLHVTQRDGFAQRRQRIAGGDELVRDVAGKSGADDGLAYGLPIQLLRVVELVAAGHAAGVKVRDVRAVVLNRAD